MRKLIWALLAPIVAFALLLPGAAEAGRPLRGAGSGGGGSTVAAWNPSDKAATVTVSTTTVSNDTITSSADASARSTTSHSTGKYVFGFTATTAYQLGLANASFGVSNAPGVDGNAFGMWSGDGNIYESSGSLGAGMSGTKTGAGMMGAVDLDAKKVWLWNSNTSLWNGDVLANQNPATGAGGRTYTVSGALFIVGSPLTTGAVVLTAPASPPAGFTSWGP